MKKLILFLFLLLLNPNIVFSQDNFYDDSLVSESAKIPYLLSLPSNYGVDSTARHPLMLFLHGGDRSNTNHHPKKYAIKSKIDFPFIVIAPHCKSGCRWDEVNFGALVNEVVSQYDVDESRIYVTGNSMGGFGTWSALVNFPNLFTAAAPICGGGDPSKICVAKNTVVKAFHAKDDNVVQYKRSLEMIETMKGCGADATLKTAKTGGHEIWPSVYKDAEFYSWLLSISKDK